MTFMQLGARDAIIEALEAASHNPEVAEIQRGNIADVNARCTMEKERGVGFVVPLEL